MFWPRIPAFVAKCSHVSLKMSKFHVSVLCVALGGAEHAPRSEAESSPQQPFTARRLLSLIGRPEQAGWSLKVLSNQIS